MAFPMVSRPGCGYAVPYLRGVVGAVLIAFSLYSLARPTLPAVKGGRFADGIVGLMSGAFGGSTGLAGIPVIVWPACVVGQRMTSARFSSPSWLQYS